MIALPPRLYLFDTLFHLFRAYYAVPRTLRASDGTPTNAVHGVLGILRTLWRAEDVEYVGLVFEKMSGIFREKISADYKAQREPTPEDLLRQIPLVQEACCRLGLSTWEMDGFEADDVIGTIARLALENGVPVSIVSNDKDLAQLLALDGDIELLRTKGSSKDTLMERVRRDDVPRLFGVRADQIASFLALRGDVVDNIAGLKGVGDKTAARWLSQVQDLEELLEKPEVAGARWRPVIVENADNLRRDLLLSTIRTDLPISFSLESFQLSPFDGLPGFFERLSMKRHRGEVEALPDPTPTVRELWAG